MNNITRRTATGLLLTAAGLAAIGLGGGYLLGELLRSRAPAGSGMMGMATSADMNMYMELFNRHKELTRKVKEIPGGVRTTTESESHELTSQLQAHVSSMYGHLEQGREVTCMSQSLPSLFRKAPSYKRQLTFTPKGVVATETSSDPEITRLIRQHAQEVTGFVRDGMPAMMQGMMG